MTLIWPAQPMRDPDIFVTDFSEYTVGAQPPDWTNRYVTGGFTFLVQNSAGSISGQALRWTKTASNRQAISWDRVPLVADVEILMRARKITAGSDSDNFVNLYARGSGSAGSETGYRMATGNTTNGNKWSHALTRYSAGSGSAIGGQGLPSPTDMSTNAWFWARFRLSGTQFLRRAWLDSNSEPGTWANTDTDSGVTSVGWVGLHNVTSSPNVEIDFYSVALRGKTAPRAKR
ncbi:hypothetical protein [Mesorhizobium comanense]|uniref:hypothetical protein n=1 Tax=Mesorhizobium comanense TaxID=2502215 RepID=UPI0010F44F0A|nr:hypothetical protein [Mesorhizobium comanense]